MNPELAMTLNESKVADRLVRYMIGSDQRLRGIGRTGKDKRR